MKSTAVAPANIAFIKYWGKQDELLHLPLNSSFSMNLSGAYTTTTVEFSEKYKEDEIEFILSRHAELVSASKNVLRSRNEFGMTDKEKKRISTHLDLLRVKAGVKTFAKVVTQNTFPKGSGIASSASGFAALTVAATTALGLDLSEKELTILARCGSGSAARSIPDGFVQWKSGATKEESYAYSLYPHTYWDVRDAICIVETEMKQISSTGGMKDIATSPYLSNRLHAVPKRLQEMKTAVANKNFTLFGELIEADCLSMHQVMQTQNPPLHYWNETTKMLMERITLWRKSGLEVYFTIDAGPNVHVLYQGKDEVEVISRLKKTSDIKEIITNKPALGVQVIKEHLF